MLTRHVFLAFVLFATVASASARASDDVALLPLVGDGLGSDVVARVQRTLQNEVDAKFGSASVPGDAVRARLDAGSAKGLHCNRSETACAVQLGIVVRADRVIVATLAAKGAASSLSLHVVDVGEAEQLAAVTGAVSAEPSRAEVAALFAGLDAPAAKATRVHVTGPIGASVVVDGAARGSLPIDDIVDLEPGKHAISVVAAVHHDVKIEVRRGETETVEAPAMADVLLAPKAHLGIETKTAAGTAEDTLPSLPWVALVGGASAAVVGAIGVVTGMAPRVGYDDAATKLHAIEDDVGTDRAALVDRQDDITRARSDLDRNAAAWNQWGAPLTVTAVLLGSAGVVAAGAGIYGVVVE